MKRYIKDGQIKFRNQIVLRGTRTITDKDGKEKEVRTQIINPKEEMLLADGWVEYTIPEQTAEELLERAKRDLRFDIERHDSSPEVNGFYIQGEEMWLDKSTRAGLMLRFQSEQAIGREMTSLWYGGQMYELPLQTAFNMLYALEVYASACYDNTQRHLAAINGLGTIEEVESYDYREGYPTKLEF